MRTLLRRLAAQRKLRIWGGIFLLATVWVWQRYAVVQCGDRIAQSREQIGDLIETRDALLAETTTLSARTRIEAIAVARLGLWPVTDKQRRRLPGQTGGDQSHDAESLPASSVEGKHIAQRD